MTAPAEPARGFDAALEWASREIESMGYGRVHERRRDSGRQGMCAVIDCDKASVVLKWFDPARHADVAGDARHEFEALEQLGTALAGLGTGASGRRLVAPGPIACATAVPAFLMEYLPGSTLDSILSSAGMDAAEQRAVASAVARGVVAFHDRTREPYGDIHFANVIVDGSDVGLIDPGSSRSLVQRGRSLTGYPLSVDVAAWLLSIGFSSPRRYVREWRLARRRAAFSVELIAAMLEEGRDRGTSPAPVLRESLELVRDDTRKASGTRARVAGATVQMVAYMVARRVRRRLSDPQRQPRETS
jgi:hypothetical protein